MPEAYQWLLVPTQNTPQAKIEWQAFRLSGQDALAVRVSKKLKNDELLVTSLAGTRLRMDLDRVPLWRGDHVSIKQLTEDFARYLYLPRLAETKVLLDAINDGLTLLTWEDETFAYADGFDEATGKYRGLRSGQRVHVTEADSGLVVKSEAARRQLSATSPVTAGTSSGNTSTAGAPGPTTDPIQSDPFALTSPPQARPQPKRFHGSVALDATRVGRDAGRIADEVIAHLAGLVGSDVKVTLEIQAEVPNGVPEKVVRTVTENSRTLKFKDHGFEES